MYSGSGITEGTSLALVKVEFGTFPHGAVAPPTWRISVRLKKCLGGEHLVALMLPPLSAAGLDLVTVFARGSLPAQLLQNIASSCIN